MSAVTSAPLAGTPPELLLASSSRYRKALLERLGLNFATASPDIDESRHDNEPPADLVQRLAREKAAKLANTQRNHLIIGSDQVASLDDRVLGKPGSVERAEQQLAELSGHTVRFYTGLALLNSATNNVQVQLDVTDVEFRILSAAEISAYVAREQPLDCAGSFKSEGLGVALFERIKTQDPAALIGLPLVRLCAMLRAEGMNPLASPS